MPKKYILLHNAGIGYFYLAMSQPTKKAMYVFHTAYRFIFAPLKSLKLEVAINFVGKLLLWFRYRHPSQAFLIDTLNSFCC